MRVSPSGPPVMSSPLGAPSLPVHVVVEGNAPAMLEQQCQALGLHLGQPSRGEAAATLLAGVGTEPAVERGLSEPFSGFVELGAEGLLGVGLRCFETARAGGVALSLRTDTVYRLSPLEQVAHALRHRFMPEARETVEQMVICLGEAISNAVMHGNLQVPPHLRVNSRGFQLFRQIMQERLADPIQVGRRVEIHLLPRGEAAMTVMVSDQGGGFNLDEHLCVQVDSTAKRGRGLGLIRRVCSSLQVEDGGRTLVMTFVR